MSKKKRSGVMVDKEERGAGDGKAKQGRTDEGVMQR